MRFLEKLLVSDSSIIMGRKLLPGIYSLGKDDVQKERNEPGSATRNPCGQIPHLWGQALFIICRLLIEGCLTPRRVSKLILNWSAPWPIRLAHSISGPMRAWAWNIFLKTRLSELDPLNRRLTTEKKAQVQVQVAVIAQSNLVKKKLFELGFDIQARDWWTAKSADRT